MKIGSGDINITDNGLLLSSGSEKGIVFNEIMSDGYILEFTAKSNSNNMYSLQFFNSTNTTKQTAHSSYYNTSSGNPRLWGITGIIPITIPDETPIKYIITNTQTDIYADNKLIATYNGNLAQYYFGFKADNIISFYIKNLKIYKL